jgi:hypothetical protein
MASSVAPKVSIFISYKRNIDPDNSLAAKVFGVLQGCGHDVFIDRTIRVGQEWAEEIEKNVRRSEYLIVFLTQASIASEMVKGEVEIARDQRAKTGKPKILPVRLAYTGALPYPLGAWLDPLQYTLWQSDADTERLIGELEAAVGGSELPAKPVSTGSLSPGDSPPLYSAPLSPPGGGLDVDDPWYIHRTSDDEAFRTISQHGLTMVIKGSRQMGKTSLLARVINKAMQMGKRCALIDFQMLGRESLASQSAFFQRFSREVEEGLDLGTAGATWDKGLSYPQNLTHQIEKNVLAVLDAPLVLAIDEADFLFQASFSSDFFGMLRSWHNRRGNVLKGKLWKKLDIVLVISTEPYLLIESPYESPFNVAEVVYLSDFDVGQVRGLNQMHQSPLQPTQVDQLYELLHGQPYLTRKAFHLIKSGTPAVQVFASAANDTGPFGDHLRNYFLRLLNYPDVAAALKQVMLGRGCSNKKLAYRLESAGLVKTEGDKVVPRCRLYAEYFGDRL